MAGFKYECSRPDLNWHGHESREILSLLCLPIPPLEHKKDETSLVDRGMYHKSQINQHQKSTILIIVAAGEKSGCLLSCFDVFALPAPDKNVEQRVFWLVIIAFIHPQRKLDIEAGLAELKR